MAEFTQGDVENTLDEVLLRDVRESDFPFIFDSWIRSYKTSWFLKGVPRDLYRRYHQKVITRLLSRSSVVVACYKANQDVIAGWSAIQKTADNALIIHYMYVKEQARDAGLAKAMVNVFLQHEKPAAVFYSHRTIASGVYMDKHPDCDWIYNPYLAFIDLPAAWEVDRKRA